ncbi:MAG: hypothetical protein RBU30_06955 [Polyangia bacterium]|jgi:predicted transcriptional regulator of viral defense system|nr:hypothetical protein [Polyangia bacterium]
MRFDDLVERTRTLPWFDLATVVQLVDEPRQSVLNQLSRFSRAGKLIPLRRGMYVLGERYRRIDPTPAELAGALYRPSYLSDVWALSYHGLIPEGVAEYTSVTTRTTKAFQNSFGVFSYRNVKQEMFFGYSPVILLGRRALLASAEKALVDHFYLSLGEWTQERMMEMRFSRPASLDVASLETMIHRAGKARLRRAFRVWDEVTRETAAGEMEL